MTGLEKIIEQIELDAKETAQSHLAEAEKQAKAILEETKQQIENELAKQTQVLEDTKEAIISRAKSSAELETRKIILKTKQMLIEKALFEAKEKLTNLEKDEYFEVLLKLAEKYSGTQKLEMQLNQNDLARVSEDFKSKLPENIMLSAKCANIQSGFLLIGDGIDENCSFDALFADKIEQLQDTAASILF